MGRFDPVPLVMHGRLCGGSAVPGSCVCNQCHIGGCWATEPRCSRCGAPRPAVPQDNPVSGNSRRENQCLGKGAKPKSAPVNPTYRVPHVFLLKKGASVPRRTLLTPLRWLQLFGPLGFLGNFLHRLKPLSGLLLPQKTERKEQRMLQLRGLIDTAKAHAARLDRSIVHHRSQLDTCMANRAKKYGRSCRA